MRQVAARRLRGAGGVKLDVFDVVLKREPHRIGRHVRTAMAMCTEINAAVHNVPGEARVGGDIGKLLVAVVVRHKTLAVERKRLVAREGGEEIEQLPT